MQIHDLNTGTPASGHYLAMDSGTDTYKATPGNIKPAYTTGDSSTATSWTSVTAVATGLSFSTLINRITTMMKNVRYLYNILGSSTFSTVASTVTGAIGNTALGTTATTLSGAIAEHESDLGNTDISGIGDGTVTGALSTLNGKATYYSLGSNAGIDTITTTSTNHTLYNSRKFSDYSLLVVTAYDSYARASIVLPSSVFISPQPINISWVDSVNAQRWAELAYVSDTSYSLVGNAGANGKYIRLIGML